MTDAELADIRSSLFKNFSAMFRHVRQIVGVNEPKPELKVLEEFTGLITQHAADLRTYEHQLLAFAGGALDADEDLIHGLDKCSIPFGSLSLDFAIHSCWEGNLKSSQNCVKDPYE